VCSYTDPQVSMDLLRAVLQPSFNDDILAVFRKYQKVRDNSGGWAGVDGCEQVWTGVRRCGRV